MEYPQARYEGGTDMIRFEHPLFLFLIALIIPCLAVTFFYIEKIRRTYSHVHSVRLLKYIKIRSGLWAISWGLLCAAAAVPLAGTRDMAVMQQGSALVFAVDISRSMTAADITPTRLDFVKQYIDFMLTKLPSASCALVLIKGSGVLSVPLSGNHQSLAAAVQTLSPLALTSPGTNLEQGLLTALQAFPEHYSGSKTIVLFTDGDETSGSIMRTAPQLRTAGITLIAVGLGTEAGGTVTILTEDGQSSAKHCTLNDRFLKRLVQDTGNGSFYTPADSQGSVWKAIQAIENTGTRKMYTTQVPMRHSAVCGLAALFFLCAGVLTGGLYGKKTPV